MRREGMKRGRGDRRDERPSKRHSEQPPPLYALEDDLERVFDIRRSTPCPAEPFDAGLAEFGLVESEFDAALMVADGRWVAPETVLALWTQKSRMDPLFSKENRALGAYQLSRNTLFAGDVRGSKVFRNRAGDKLFEVLQHSGIATALEQPRRLLLFADVCGGPGAFSEVVFKLSEGRAEHTIGIGTTLAHAKGGTADWYPALMRDSRFVPVYGPDGTGDMYNPATVTALEHEVRGRDERGAYAVLADGGFNVTSDDLSIENIQELYTARLLLAELLAAISTLRAGGHFICKMFDTFSDFMASFLYVCALLFDRVKVVKPARSRTVNSERYLAASGFRDVGLRGGARYWLVEHVRALHTACYTHPTPPRSLVPLALMEGDSAFRASMRHLNETLAKRQTSALLAVLDEVDWSRIVPVAPIENPQGPRFVLPESLRKLKEKQRQQKEEAPKETEKATEQTKDATGEASQAEAVGAKDATGEASQAETAEITTETAEAKDASGEAATPKAETAIEQAQQSEGPRECQEKADAHQPQEEERKKEEEGTTRDEAKDTKDEQP